MPKVGTSPLGDASWAANKNSLNADHKQCKAITAKLHGCPKETETEVDDLQYLLLKST